MPGHASSASSAGSVVASAAPAKALRHGRLFYVMGASGAGKDSIIAGCRSRLHTRHHCLIAHRYITRKPEVDGENHVWLSETEFSQRLALGCFAMHWSAHGLHYGISLEIDSWLRNGCHVIVNGSRGHLSEAQQRYAENLTPVHILVDPELLRARLIARGREDATSIELRIRRAQDYHMAVSETACVVRNDGALVEAVGALLAVIEQAVNEHEPVGDGQEQAGAGLDLVGNLPARKSLCS